MRSVKLTLLRTAAGLCAALCLFSAVMTGTYAWQSEQEVINDLWGEADTMVPVELTKLEINAAGEKTDTPVADAVFYLYKSDGTQIGVRYVTGEDGKISVRLGVGEYYFEEAAPKLGYTYDVDDEGNALTKFPFTIHETADPETPVTLTVYNRRLGGDLVISKLVENSDGTPLSESQKELAFTFTVTFTEADGTESDEPYTYTINSGAPRTIVSGGTLSLRSGEAAVFANLPAGLLYNVVETPVAGYTIAGTGHRGNISEHQASLAAFVNTCVGGDTGTLVVTKEVQGEGADPARAFDFSVTFGEVTETFTLKSGESKSFRDIALGTDYIVRELEPQKDGYTALVDTFSGTLTEAGAVTLPFVNVYKTEAPAETGTLVVKKTVTGEKADPAKRFAFAVMFDGENAPADPEPFYLANGEEKRFENLPHGVSYIVMEMDAAGYLPAWDAVKGTVIGGETVTAEAVNAVPATPEVLPTEVKLTVKKVLSGEVLASDAEREFQMTLTVNGAAVPFTLKGGESHEFTVPYGAVYEVKEADYYADGFSQSITNGSGTATKDTEVTVTNTYVGEPRVEISGEKTWVIPEGVSVTLPETITVRLKDGETVVEEQTVTADAQGKWLYTFLAPQYRADGVTEISYTIEEVPVEFFHTAYDGWNIVNTYVVPVEADPPVIIKKVEGKETPAAWFTFVFTGQQGAPMPAGAVGYQKEVTLTGSGEVEIGALTFTKAGTYVYTVHEKNGGEQGWTYDTALYTVTYEVTEDARHQLSLSRTITKNTTAVEAVQFTNTYAPEVERVVISGEKTWDHGNNPVQNRPTSVIIEVYGNGTRVYQQQLTAAEGWRYSVALPRYDDAGREIVYTVDEQAVAGYRKAIRGYNITNTYNGGTTPVPPVTPDVPESPEKPDSSDTGDHSNMTFWLMLTLGSMLGTVVMIREAQAQAYVGKRVYRAKRLKK